MKNPKLPIIGLMLLVLVLISCQVQHYKYPIKTAAYWTSPVMSLEEARNLALYSIIIVDGENTINNLKSLKLIKKLNKEVKLIYYSNPMEIFEPMANARPMQKAMAEEILQKYPQWLLKTSDGENAVFYPGMIMLNLSTDCPRVNGKNYIEYLAKKDSIVFSKNAKLFSGRFIDNCSGNISWVTKEKKSQIDADNDKINDNPDSLDYKWSQGMQNYLSVIRQSMDDTKLIIGNKGSLEFMDKLDGRMFEWFPNDYLGGKKNFGWDQSMINSKDTGPFTIFLVKPDEIEFGLASAYLAKKDSDNENNIYIGVGQDNSSVHPEFNIHLGKPLDKAHINDTCYFRNYENGRVEVKPWKREGKIIQFKK